MNATQLLKLHSLHPRHASCFAKASQDKPFHYRTCFRIRSLREAQGVWSCLRVLTYVGCVARHTPCYGFSAAAFAARGAKEGIGG